MYFMLVALNLQAGISLLHQKGHLHGALDLLVLFSEIIIKLDTIAFR
jgi:hypothetical protein